MNTRTKLLRECETYYAGRGWPVLVTHWITPEGRCSCGKEDCPSPGKHPLTEHGLHDATTDLKQISVWRRRWPEANIGIRTGREPGLVVLDMDPRHGGNETIKRYCVPETLRVRTGGGGLHFYFRYPQGRTITSGTNKLGPGLDVKADGGYVLGVPSNHLQGLYGWDGVGPSKERDVPIAECPAWILALDTSGRHANRQGLAGGAAGGGSAQAVARECLKLLGPERADDYTTWIQVGMICHRVGLSCDEWSDWSRQSNKYRPGEPERKWNSFALDHQNGVGVGTLIVWAAQDQGVTTGELPARIAPEFHLTDSGNAERFALEHSHCLR